MTTDEELMDYAESSLWPARLKTIGFYPSFTVGGLVFINHCIRVQVERRRTHVSIAVTFNSGPDDTVGDFRLTRDECVYPVARLAVAASFARDSEQLRSIKQQMALIEQMGLRCDTDDEW